MENKTVYKTIYDALKEEIIENNYPVGSMLPTELQMASRFEVSRPTITKVYDKLQDEGFVKKKRGAGTIVLYEHDKTIDRVFTFGLLLPGVGESEIFPIINDQLLKRSESGKFNCLWDGATASSADIRRSLIVFCCDNYIEKQVDGVFFAPLERVLDADEINHQICRKLQAANIPVILIDRDIVKNPLRSEFDIVCLDNFNAGSVMATHLIDAGCELIYYFYRPDSAFSVLSRLSGIRDTVLNKGLKFGEKNIICADPSDLKVVRQMKIIPGKTGVICANDSTAAVLMSTLDEAELKISTDLLICGFDDMKYSNHLKHALTSFRQPCTTIADMSIDLMFRRLSGNPKIPVTASLRGELNAKESTKFVNGCVC
ncbi:MAG: GntR family transcriptional regulator [Tannerella sp.]|jgi:DNA-binding LacI/PurR family transcriptional regulator|nr:GntR family transcriptional regulator [Tannerella sp.]